MVNIIIDDIVIIFIPNSALADTRVWERQIASSHSPATVEMENAKTDPAADLFPGSNDDICWVRWVWKVGIYILLFLITELIVSERVTLLLSSILTPANYVTMVKGGSIRFQFFSRWYKYSTTSKDLSSKDETTVHPTIAMARLSLSNTLTQNYDIVNLKEQPFRSP